MLGDFSKTFPISSVILLKIDFLNRLLQKNFQKSVTVREILLILVVFWDHFLYFVALLTIVTLFAVFLFVLNYFLAKK